MALFVKPLPSKGQALRTSGSFVLHKFLHNSLMLHNFCEYYKHVGTYVVPPGLEIRKHG